MKEHHHTSFCLKFVTLLIFLFLGSSSLEAQLFHENLANKGELSFDDIVKTTEKHYDKIGRERGKGYKQFQRWKYWAERNLDANRKVRSNFQALKEYNKFTSKTATTNRNFDGIYEELGPQATINTSTWSSALGRVSAIGLDPTDDNHVIVGSPTGGIWKTTDLGGSWTPLYDFAALIDVYSLEISHLNSDHYWAGLNGALIKSTDGGMSWTNTSGAPSSQIYNTVEMHPADASILFAVAQSGGQVVKSNDGGSNFYTVMDHVSQMYDLEFHPTDPNIIYASGNGAMYKSTDTGESFSEITSGPWSGNTANTMMMAVGPAEANYVYVLEETGGGFNAIYLSTDEGLTWTTITDNTCGCQNMLGYDQNGTGGQAPRDMDIIVSPTDPNEIHIAGTETWRSLDLGQNWNQTTEWNVPGASNFIHADIDLLIYDNNRIVAGTDGGIYLSTDEAVSWTDITFGLGIRQFYRIGASQTDADRVSGGSQDNGTGILVAGSWYDFMGADGMETFIDWSNADKVYGTTQFGGLYKSADGGQTVSSFSGPGGNGNWVTPFEQDTEDPSTIYTGREELFKSTNEGGTWEAISAFAAGSLDELKIAPSDNQYIYVAIDGNMHYTSNGGSSWNSSAVGSGVVNYISVNPYDPLTVALAVSGSANRVLESTDGGATWTNIAANLPAGVGIECVLYEPIENGGLFCGGNPGIYYTANTTSPSWEDDTHNLPLVRVTELDIRNQVMYVGTYGRGLWKFEFVCDGSLTGTSCTDNDPCTTDDVFDENCNCVGILADSDGDGVCDGLDVCDGGDDSIDGDNDGIPDFCDGCALDCPDSDCDSVCDEDDICPDGDDTRDMDNDGIPDWCDPCDEQIGQSCNDGNDCTVDDSYDSDCNCVGNILDSDGDGVCDADDLCGGFDDNLDQDGDGIPDDCDNCDNAVFLGINIMITLDNYPEETSWDLKDSGGTVVASGGTYGSNPDGSLVIEQVCNLATSCFEFTIYDSYGDGICCGYGNGSYIVTNSAGITIAMGGEFASSEITAFCLDCSENGGDTDGDGFCDDVDCDINDPNIGSYDIGSNCDDGDICTIDDVWVTACDCAGTYIDTDGDTVCDTEDNCPDGDDTIDSDGDGIPDDCDACDLPGNISNFHLEIDFDGFPYETSWDIVDGAGNVLVSSPPYDSYTNDDIISVDICVSDGCFVFNIYDSGGDGLCCPGSGETYYLFTNIEGDTIAYGSEINHFNEIESTPFCTDTDACADLGGDIDGDGICADDDCDDNDENIGGFGTVCDDGDVCTINDAYDLDCNCVGTFVDTDGDGVCDAEDLCPGGDDNLDTDGDGIPDFCDDACTQNTIFDDNPLIHQGTGQSTTVLSLPTGSSDVSFMINNLESIISGNPTGRYIDKVTVNYTDVNGNTIEYGVYSGDVNSFASINISGEVQSITVALEDGLDGDAVNPIDISFSDVSYCPGENNFITDLTLSTSLLPTNASGITTVFFVINIFEVGSANTSGTITAILPKDPRMSFNWEPNAQTIGISNVDNQDWTYDATNSAYHIWTTESTITGNGSSTFGIEAAFDPENTTGTVSYTATILSTSGSEQNGVNNIDVETLIYFSN